MQAKDRSLVSRLARKIRSGTATTEEVFEYRVCVALESASMPSAPPARTIWDLSIARRMWIGDARQFGGGR